MRKQEPYTIIKNKKHDLSSMIIKYIKQIDTIAMKKINIAKHQKKTEQWIKNVNQREQDRTKLY